PYERSFQNGGLRPNSANRASASSTVFRLQSGSRPIRTVPRLGESPGLIQRQRCSSNTDDRFRRHPAPEGAKAYSLGRKRWASEQEDEPSPRQGRQKQPLIKNIIRGLRASVLCVLRSG